MSRSERELRSQLVQASRMPEGDARIALLEDLVRHADALGTGRLSFDTRMELTSAYQHGGETGKAFVTFSWCLAAYDREPGEYDHQDDWLLRWQYKWTVAALKRFPEVPLDRSYRALDDMQRRYLAGGHSLHAVHTLRCEVANHIGDLEAGDEWYREWCAAPRDENSDCVACDPTSKVLHLALRQRDEEAVAIADPVLAGRITCNVQPESIQSALLFPYLRTGRLDEAREAHRRSYRAIRGNRDYLDLLATHLEFCALTGNEAYGLEILERHLGWLDRPADPMALMEGAGAGALLLRRLRERGHGGQRLRRPGFGDRPDTEPEVVELEEELRAAAISLAERFDTRNGTDFQSRMLAEKLNAEPMLDDLSLSRQWHRRTGAIAPAVDKPVETTVDSVDDESAPPSDDLSGLDLAALLDLADHRYTRGQLERANAAWSRFDELATDIEVDPLLAVRRLDSTGLQQAVAQDVEASATTWRTAAERYGELGEEVFSQQANGRLGVALVSLGRPDEGVPLLDASTAYLVEHGTPFQRAHALIRQVSGYRETDPERALRLLDDAERAMEELDEPALRRWLGTDIWLKRAVTLAEHVPDSLPRAAELADRARGELRRSDRLARYAEVSLFHGKLLSAQADQSDAAEELRGSAADSFAEAARYAAVPMLRAHALESRGGLLARTERAAEAVDDLVESVAMYTELGNPQAAYTRFDLAVALANAGRRLDAAECAEEGLDALEGGEDVAGVLNYRLLLARLYADLDEKTDALRQWDALAEHFESQDPTGSDEEVAAHRAAFAQEAGQAYEEAAGLLDQLDRDAEAARRFVRAADAYQRAGNPFGVVRSNRRQVLALHWSGDSEAGLTLAEQTAKQIDELPGTNPEVIAWERAALDFGVARILVGVERVEEAHARALAAVSGFNAAGTPTDAEAAQELAGDIAGYLEPGV